MVTPNVQPVRHPKDGKKASLKRSQGDPTTPNYIDKRSAVPMSQSDVSNGISGGMPYGMPYNMPGGVPNGPSSGFPVGFPNGSSNGTLSVPNVPNNTSMASNLSPTSQPLPPMSLTAQRPKPTSTVSDWSVFKTPEGVEYYYNQRTRATTYDKPDELKSEAERQLKVRPLFPLSPSPVLGRNSALKTANVTGITS